MADSDEEAERLAALRTVRTQHTGAQFESGEVYRRRGLNEPAPGVWRRARARRHINPEERQHRQPQAHGTPPLAQGRMNSFFGKRTTPQTVQEEIVAAPGRKKPKKVKASRERQMMVRGNREDDHRLHQRQRCRGPGYMCTTHRAEGNVLASGHVRAHLSVSVTSLRVGFADVSEPFHAIVCRSMPLCVAL